MESKEEISDTDSGIVVHSGPDSPTSPVKDLSTHTRAMRLKHQALEERLELCLLELRKLCIREAELTGRMSPDFPLGPEEKPPQVRRRIGAAFKLDEGFIRNEGEESVLHSLEADLALQQQIYEAARRLSLEEHLSKPVKKSRLQQCKVEERKLRELQRAALEHRIRHGCSSPQDCCSKQRDLGVSDDSSLSDAAPLDEDLEFSASSETSSADAAQRALMAMHSPRRGPHASAPSATSSSSSLEYERSPIQNSPWKETSLDQPYLKNKKSTSASSSRSSSPTGISVKPDPRVGGASQSASMRNLKAQQSHSSSAPSTPELPLRRHFSQSFRLPKSRPEFVSDQGRSRARTSRRRVSDFAPVSPQRPAQQLYQSSSEDSSSEHSVPSYANSPKRQVPVEAVKPRPPPYGFHLGGHHKGPGSDSAHHRNNQPHTTPGFSRGAELRPGPPSPARSSAQGSTSSEESPKKPPPPYSRVARAPSLREYPTYVTRMLPRDISSEDLRPWPPRNNSFRIPRPRSLDRQGSFRARRAPNRNPPAYQHIRTNKQAPQKVVLQRAPDGTPLQWFEEEDSEIVSQV
ncbi:innate immunity activator protein [Denticeps clupeoides]|uniref:Cytohesin Ubiquitin Protein Inducing domain-containing protein n=1 Tax=Denticeps clupeoides TaxID=299321 RepID=A0AAY4BYH1_9TELE|nr:innate immunity activator protein-like [Denticeps clupeoides]XP_028849515.1 innate immunity activator protein-like [Denticeps clupeoides]